MFTGGVHGRIALLPPAVCPYGPPEDLFKLAGDAQLVQQLKMRVQVGDFVQRMCIAPKGQLDPSL